MPGPAFNKKMNSIQLTGYIGKKPELRMAKNEKQTSFCKFSLSVYDPYRKKSDDTQWIYITAFGRHAKAAAEFLEKGAFVGIEGKINTSADKDRQDEIHFEVIADRIEFIRKRTQKTEIKEIDNSKAEKTPGKFIIFEDEQF